jgi:hypothetical protein
LRRGAEGRSTLLDEVSRRHPSVQGCLQGCRLQGGNCQEDLDLDSWTFSVKLSRGARP